MEPSSFPESNVRYGPPPGMTEEQVATMDAFLGERLGGPIDGSTVVIVAWKPSPEDLVLLNEGGLIYLTCIGGLPPHSLSTRFA